MYVSLGCFYVVGAGPDSVWSSLGGYVVYFEIDGYTKATNEWGW